MTPERWQQVAELCDSALSLEPARRAAFLEEACAGDALLRQELEALLACDEHSPHFLETPALEAAASALIGQQTGVTGPLFTAGLQVGWLRIAPYLGRGPGPIHGEYRPALWSVPARASLGQPRQASS